MSDSQTYTLILTPEALLDIDRLDLFIRPANPNAADRFQDVIWNALSNLTETSGLGYPWEDAPVDRHIRQYCVSFGKRGYVIRYEIAGRELIIARIHHFLEDR